MMSNDEFDFMVKNSQRVLKLNDQYKNHQYVEEFTKQCGAMLIYVTYVLEADVKFSLINRMRAWNYLQKTSEYRGHQANTQDHDGWGGGI